MQVNIYHYSHLSADERSRIFERAELDISAVMEAILPIVKDVKDHGDAALINYARKFENASLATDAIKVTEEEIAEAHQTIEPDLKAAIIRSAARIRKYHEAQLPQPEWWVELEDGVFAGEKVTPVKSIGLYVPRGKGCFPSVMMMLCTPASVAKVPQVVVCTPPTKSGKVDDASLVAADVCGIKHIYKAGGAQAIAAMAYGTETVPKVVKVIGPGNAYTSAAQRMLFGVNIGIPAGPSESLILADEHATPMNVALDLLNEAEHGPDSCAILVTHSETLAKAVKSLLPKLVEDLPSERRSYCETVMMNYGGIVITDSLEASYDFANEFAPEHMELLVAHPEEALTHIIHAGEVLLGEATPIAIANFNLGVNAILPTGRAAFCHSATNIHHFMKATSLGRLTKQGYEALKNDAQRIADYEGFPAHSAALTKRIMK